MDFYSTISEYYDYIFAFDPEQIDFIKSHCTDSSFRILDVGSATGRLAIELGKLNFDVTAFDSDEKMIAYANELSSNKGVADKVKFLVSDMLDMKKIFVEKSFQIITCFGNTVVHLTDIKQIQGFFNDCYNLLDNDGFLLIQMINYDYILEKKIGTLPLIDNEKVKFERYYKGFNGKLIDFKTILTVKDKNRVFENSIKLYPLKRETILKLLKNSGFGDIEFYSDFKRTPFSLEKLPLIISAKKITN